MMDLSGVIKANTKHTKERPFIINNFFCVSLLFFFERISFGFVGKNDKNGVSPNEKAPICKSNDFGIVPGTNKRGVQNTI